jgi:hypothetical protein
MEDKSKSSHVNYLHLVHKIGSENKGDKKYGKYNEYKKE